MGGGAQWWLDRLRVIRTFLLDRSWLFVIFLCFCFIVFSLIHSSAYNNGSSHYFFSNFYYVYNNNNQLASYPSLTRNNLTLLSIENDYRKCQSLAIRDTHGLVPKFSSPEGFLLTKETLGKKITADLKVENKVIEAKVLKRTLGILGESKSLTERLSSGNCLPKCVLVGSGGCLRQKNLGAEIDNYPIVIRVNEPPLDGFKNDVGSKTDIRILYPESAPGLKRFYKGMGIVLVSIYKDSDLIWTAKMADPSLNLSYSLWKSAPKSLPTDSKNLYVINPEISEFIWKKLKNRATTGTLAIFTALNFCSSLDIAGFCYNFSDPGGYVYYYGNRRQRDEQNYGPHSRNLEIDLRNSLLKSNLVNDLTGA